MFSVKNLALRTPLFALQPLWAKGFEVAEYALIGKQVEAEKHTHGGERGTCRGEDGKFTANRQNVGLRDDNGTKTRGTAGRVAEEHGINWKSAERAECFSKGLDAAESASPGIKDAILSGAVKAPKSTIAKIHNVPEERRREVVDAIKIGDTDTAKKIINREPVSAKSQNPEEPRPAYDVNDFKGDLMSAVKNFDFALRQHMFVVHFELLNDEEGRAAAEVEG